MEQRRLRLGDILDDYCPRERRITNHAVVAMIEEDIKQTRCTTCDTEHAYKGARVPKRRKKEAPAALYKEVLAAMPEVETPVLAAPVRPLVSTPETPADTFPSMPEEDDVIATTDSLSTNPFSENIHPPMHSDNNDQHDDTAEPPATRVDGDTPTTDGPVHRPLIRATLPRPEGQKDARPVPEFTVRHAPPRGNGQGNGHANFRGDRMRMRAGTGQREPNGNRAQGSGQRFRGERPSGSGRQPPGRAGSSGFRSGNNGPGGKRGRGPRG